MKTSLEPIYRVWDPLSKKLCRAIEINNGRITILGWRNQDNPISPEAQTMVWDRDHQDHLVLMPASPFTDFSKDKSLIFEYDLIVPQEGEYEGKIGMVQFIDGCFMVDFPGEGPMDDSNVELLCNIIDSRPINMGANLNYIREI